MKPQNFLSATKAEARQVFLVYSVATRAFMTMVFTVNLIYFVTFAGLNPLQMVLVGTTLEAAVFIFEIPTGVVADTISRRLSIIIGVFLIGLGFLVQASFPNFLLILFAQVLWGLGYTFTSGATQAWISDELGEENAANIFLQATQWEQLGAILAIGLSVLMTWLWTLRIPLAVGGVLFWVLGLYLLVRMPETQFHPAPRAERQTWQAMGKTLKTGFAMFRLRPALLRIFLIGFFFGFYSEGLDRLWVPHILERFHLPQQGETVMVGWVAAISALSMIIVFFASRVVRDWLGEQAKISQISALLNIFSVFLVGCVALFAVLRILVLSFLVLVSINVLRSLIYPLFTAWVNHRLRSDARATVLSFSSLMDSFGQIGGGPLVGVIAQQTSIQNGLLASAIFLSPVLLLFALNRQKPVEV